MRVKFILLALFILFIAASCYLASNNDSANNSSLVFKINAPMRSPGGGAPGQAGELRIKFFEAGDMQEGKDYKIDSYDFIVREGASVLHLAFYYLTKPTPININGRNVITSYFGFDSTNEPFSRGITEIDNIPAGISLRAVVDYNNYNAAYAPGPLSTNYTTNAGVSEPFTVKKGSSTTIDILLKEAAWGTVSFNSSAYSIFILAAEEFDSTLKINGNKIVKNNYLPSNYWFPNSATAHPQYIADVLPGKKLKLLIIDYNGSFPCPAGLSKTFELSPGESRKIDVDWSYTTDFSG